MAIRNRTVLGVEQLECRDTPSVIGALGGGHAAVTLIEQPTDAGTIVQLVTPGHVLIPTDPILPGLLRAVEGGGSGQTVM